jgi:hypothetical protein
MRLYKSKSQSEKKINSAFEDLIKVKEDLKLKSRSSYISFGLFPTLRL